MRPIFRGNHNRHLTFSRLLLQLSQNHPTLQPITNLEVEKILTQLKQNKAPDLFGIQAEHIKMASRRIVDTLRILINQIVQSGKIPDNLKLECLCPVPKKGKNRRNPNSYRRITFTSIVGKMLEIHMLNLARNFLDSTQNPAQNGFMAGDLHSLLVSKLLKR